MGAVATLFTILVVLHVLFWAVALLAMNFIPPQITPGTAHATAAALVTGLLLVGLWEMTDVYDEGPNHAKIGVKLVVALAAVVVAYTQQRKPAPNSMAYVLAALIGLNVAIAIAW
ncbi:hypothetical protein BHE97_17355 [Aeromicrobium sp. PE09-221]|nr:hypothetical protein BHE97_17355 [Aeromicrobium sp. PE09-221]